MRLGPSAAIVRARDGSRMAETPLYGRLGAKPESPVPKGRRPVCKAQQLLYIPYILDNRDNLGYL